MIYSSSHTDFSISDDLLSLSFDYGADQQRRRQVYEVDGTIKTTHYYVGSYEKIVDEENNITREVNYISGGNGTCAMWVIENGLGSMHYLYRDHLGSIVTVTDDIGTVEFEQNFDPWGRYRDPNTWQYLNQGLAEDHDQNSDNIADWVDEIAGSDWSWFRRGYTGHEMLPEFGLINMNGRAYDPVLGRMLQVDNYVQNPFSSQSYNRYSYAMNNPLRYVDPSGEFIGTVLTAIWDFIDTVFTNGAVDPWNTTENRRAAWRKFDPTRKGSKTNKAWRIDSGLFKTDGNRTVAGNAIMLWSRFTRELPQTILGNLFSHARNISGDVTDVSYYGGATLVNKNDPDNPGRWGLTLGNYINGEDIVADPYTDQLFRHEYGHTLQSRLMGRLYLTSVGVPSLIGSGLDALGWHNHDDEWNEIQANRMAFRYFNNHEPNSLIFNPETTRGRPWNNNVYPREYVYDKYFAIFHPPLIFSWWLAF